MSIAKDALDQLSQDPATHRLARERDEAIKLYRFELLVALAEPEPETRAVRLEALDDEPMPVSVAIALDHVKRPKGRSAVKPDITPPPAARMTKVDAKLGQAG
jgi:hypothetical protein